MIKNTPVREWANEPPVGGGMEAEQFRAWRKDLGLKQRKVAELLGLKKRMIQYYEKGVRDGRSVEVPRAVRLACYAISLGIVDFDGRKGRRMAEELYTSGHYVAKDQTSGPTPTFTSLCGASMSERQDRKTTREI